MGKNEDDIRLVVAWQEADFDAYVRLNQRMRAHMAPVATMKQGPALYVHLAAVYFALPVMVVVGLALWWGTSPVRVPDLAPNLVAVFLIVWSLNCLAMQALGWSSDRSGMAELREAFDRDVGIRADVTLDAEGFAVAAPGFEGRYSWSDGPVVCERWAGHVVVLHGRMPLLIPLKDAPDDLFERIIEWLEDAWSRSN